MQQLYLKSTLKSRLGSTFDLVTRSILASGLRGDNILYENLESGIIQTISSMHKNRSQKIKINYTPRIQ